MIPGKIKRAEKESAKEILLELDLSINSTFNQVAEGKLHYSTGKDNLTISDLFSDRMLTVFAIQEGIPFKLFSLIQKLSPFSNAEWGELLNLSTKSINRYKASNKRFKALQSERIIELAEVTKLGLEVFDSSEQFRLWLETPNFALGSRKPKDLLNNSYGKELVIGELTRIDQGIFA
jgi:putative toxin-antitoxin system antitoxin component (TIGR02293 family)